jgi:hypothetical protein
MGRVRTSDWRRRVAVLVAALSVVALLGSVDSGRAETDVVQDCAGTTFLDRSKKAVIRFIVWCGIQEERVGVALRPRREHRVLAFSKRLRIDGSGAGNSRCHRDRKGVVCFASKTGPVVLRGWFQVKGGRCHTGVSVLTGQAAYTSRPAGCPGVRKEQPPSFVDVAEFRDQYGLDLDLGGDPLAIDQRIREILRAWHDGEPVARSSRWRWTVPMRAVDVAEMLYRNLYLQQAGDTISRWVEGHAAATYAGYYVEHSHGGLIYVGFTENQIELVEALKRDSGFVAPERIAGFPVPPRYSLGELNALQGELWSAWDSLGSAMVSLRIDIASNRVVVGAQDLDTVRNWVLARFGAEAPIFVVYSRPAQLFDGTSTPKR